MCVCDEQLPWGIQHCSHTLTLPQENPSCSIPAQNPGTAVPGHKDFTGASKMGGADGLAAGVTVKAGLLILQRPLL